MVAVSTALGASVQRLARQQGIGPSLIYRRRRLASRQAAPSAPEYAAAGEGRSVTGGEAVRAKAGRSDRDRRGKRHPGVCRCSGEPCGAAPRARLLVLDEVHVLEAVFGNHVAFLLRRLRAARSLARRSREPVPQLQIIAASATIANAAEHLEALTGTRCEVIDEGAPARCLHLNHRRSAHTIFRPPFQALRWRRATPQRPFLPAATRLAIDLIESWLTANDLPAATARRDGAELRPAGA